MSSPPAAPPRRAPAPPGHWLLGGLPAWQADPLRMMLGGAKRCGDVFSTRFGPVLALFFRHPDHVQEILQLRHRNYLKRTLGWSRLRETLGNGILTSEGDYWLRQRRIMQPAFHRESLEGFAAVMAEESESLSRSWEAAAARKGEVDVSDAMMRLTLRIAARCLFGADLAREEQAVGAAMTVVMHRSMERIIKPYLSMPSCVPTPANRELATALRTLDRVVRGLIARRRKDGGAGRDLLGMLMAARDQETGEGMSDEQLRDEVLVLLLAGHETTATALSWTFYLLSRHPGEGRKVRDEARRTLGSRPAAAEHLPSLEKARRAVLESMRLYPPAWLIARLAQERDVVGGCEVPAGATVFVSPYLTHRHPGFWENPEGFDPDRFEGDALARLPRFAYFPFGGGPRQCIGNHFAMMEATLVAASLCRRWRLDLEPGWEPVPEPLVTLRPREPLRMRLQPA